MFHADEVDTLATIASSASPSLSNRTRSLFGRDEEIQSLRSRFEDLKVKKQRQLVLISGYSGTGKSVLASSLAESATMDGGMYASGKFDYQHRNEPYTAVIMGCSEICGTLLNSAIDKPLEFERFQKGICQKLGSELPLLMQVIPALAEIAPDTAQSADGLAGQAAIDRAANGLSSMESKHRVNYAFQRFLRHVCEHFKTLVFVVDDLHWADAASLHLLDKLVTDSELDTMMLLCTYRSNEVSENHPLSRYLMTWRSKMEDLNCVLTELEIGNLDENAVVCVVKESLAGAKDSSVVELAKLCVKKTHGNVFYLRLFLARLHEKGLLYYDGDDRRLTWNQTEIDETIPASENVVNLLQASMSSLPPDHLEILKLAACFGACFDLAVLVTVWQKLSPASDSLSSGPLMIPRALEALAVEGYLERMGGYQYRFVHDKIQESSSSLIPDEQRLDYYRRVGKILLETQNLDSMIFVTVDMLNKGTVSEQKNSRLELASLNCKACRKAFGLSAFEAAAGYADNGIKLLGSDRWVNHYQLSLDLYSMAAEAESVLGRVEKMDSYCAEVLAVEDRPLEDKFRAYNTLIDGIGNRGRTAEAAKCALELLERFDCKFPTGKVSGTVSAVAQIARLKLTIKTWSSEGVGRLMVMKDPVRRELCRLLDKLVTFLYQMGDDRMSLVTFRILQWTRKYGMNDYTPPAMAVAGVILVGILGDFQGASTVGNSAIKALDKVERPLLVESRVLFVLHSFVLHWAAPFKDMLLPLLRGYEVGLNSGDTESACWSIHMYMCTRFIIGHPLEQLVSDAGTYLVQMKELKRLQSYNTLRIHRQMWMNLMDTGSTGDPLVLEGKSISKEELKRLRDKDVLIDNDTKICEAILYAHYGAHEKLAETVVEDKGADSPMLGTSNHIPHAFARGLSCFAAYGKIKDREYLRMGKIMRSKIKSWVTKGNPNVVHLASILDAEFHASKGDIHKAIKTFGEATELSRSGGFLLDAALACERLGELCLKHDQKDKAQRHLVEAMRFYKDVDAFGKLNQLERKHANLIPKPTEIIVP